MHLEAIHEEGLVSLDDWLNMCNDQFILQFFLLHKQKLSIEPPGVFKFVILKLFEWKGGCAMVLLSISIYSNG